MKITLLTRQVIKIPIHFYFVNLNVFVTAHADKAAENNFNIKHSFLSEINSASEQAGKAELGKNKTVICYYTNNQVCIK